ncbi:MAG: poly(A) polymerase [Planctomycetota bacterium]|jgi:poly(A) polymerase
MSRHKDRSKSDPEPEIRRLSPDDIPNSSIHQDALRVLSRLTRAGHEAYLVGGCVRDLILGRRPKDFDLATSAHPRQVKRLFRNGRIIGRRFKLVHVVYGRHIIETATFRGEPSDSADGDDLLITDDNTFGTAGEDAVRRDFTINGLFLDPFKRRVIDYVGGLKDLEDGVLKTIGSPPVRMAEDPVRILRAIKFATRIGFRIEDETWDAMCNQAEELSRSAPPRVMEEILRMLRSGTALGAIRMMRASGALRVLLPTIDDFLGRRDDPDPAAHDRADSYWRLLEALDADIHSGRDPSGAVCVAVAFLRIVEREADPKTRTLPGPPEDLFTVAGEVLAPVAEQNRMSRKDLIRARRIIANQPRFTQTGARRFKPVLFMRGEDFKESLFLFRLRSAAWGQGWDIYEGWVERYEQALKVGIDDLTEEESSSRRRRRRPRRRRTSRTSREGSAPDSEAG